MKYIGGVESAITFFGIFQVLKIDGSGILQEFQRNLFSPFGIPKDGIGSMQNFIFLPLGWDVEEIFTTDGIDGSQY